MKLSRLRHWLLLPAIAALVCGILSGLSRLGWTMPDAIVRLHGVHGALMTGGFFGTVISLERAVALGGSWPYAAPLQAALAATAMIFWLAPPLAPVLLCLAAMAMAAACFNVWLMQPAVHHEVLTLAALLWLAGNATWLASGDIARAVPLWAAFLLLTIAAERLELSRLAPTPPSARRVFTLIVIGVAAGALAAAVGAAAGLPVFAVSLLALSLWLLRYDIARRTVRTAGLTRHIAICLLLGFVWLGVAAALGMAGAFASGSVLRDAALHALLLGFVFSMVFGHAPIILPAVTGTPFRWHRGFYLPLALLQLSLAARVACGWLERFDLKQMSALANAFALLLFVLMTAASLWRDRAAKVARGAAVPVPAP